MLWHYVRNVKPTNKEGEMNHLHDAVLNCLVLAEKQVNEAVVYGISVMLIGADKVVRHESVAENCDELLEDMLLCSWATLRKMNPDATPDGFAQAAHAVAMRAENAIPSVNTFPS
jgi:hypothetical protein